MITSPTPPPVLFQMSRFLDMKAFGDAARYLRLTNLEHLAAKAQAFDGTPTLSNSSDRKSVV